MEASNGEKCEQWLWLIEDSAWTDDNKKNVYICTGTQNAPSNVIGDRVAALEIDASALASGANVNVTKGSWGTGNTAGQINFTPSAGNGSISGIRLVMTGSWGSGADAYKYSYDIRDNWGHLGNGIADGISTNLTGVIDATSLVSDAIANAGQANLVWNTLEDAGSLPQSRTIYAKRSGNTEATKALYLVADENWTNNAKYVYLCQDAQNAANGVAKIQIDAAGVYTQGANDVRITRVSAYNSSTNTLTTTFGKSMGTADNKNIAIGIGTVTNSGFVYTIPVTVDGSDSSVKYYFDTEGFYNQGKADGKDEVTLTATGWSANSSYTTYTKRVYKTSGQTGNGGTYDISLSKGSTTYNNFIYSTPILDNGSATGLTVDVDGSYLYSFGVNNGKATVDLADLRWNDFGNNTPPSMQTISATTLYRTNSSGTTENITKTLSLSLVEDDTWSNSRKNVYLKAGNTTIAQKQVNASGLVSGVNFYDETLWSSGNKTITLSNGRQKTIAVPTPTDYSVGKIGDNRYSVSFLVGGKAFTYSDIYITGGSGEVTYAPYYPYGDHVTKVLVDGADKDWIQLEISGNFVVANNSNGQRLARLLRGATIGDVRHPSSELNRNIAIKLMINGSVYQVTSRPMDETDWSLWQ